MNARKLSSNLLTTVFCTLGLWLSSQEAPDLQIDQMGNSYQVQIFLEGKKLLSSPQEGLWSIATKWNRNWPTNWHHALPSKVEKVDDWTVLGGKIKLPQGEWVIRDAYRPEGTKIKCIRRYEWMGDTVLKEVTLAIRWAVDQIGVEAFLPGILYYGNPSGEKNGSHKIPVYHGQPGEEALFEEHRYPMPFACLEWQENERIYGAAMHTVPSLVPGGNLNDQWWSLGVQSNLHSTELISLSGPIGYNKQRSVAKALQGSGLPYNESYMNVQPGMIIEKTFFLEVFPLNKKGTGFQKPVHTSIEIFKPFYVDDLPTAEDILSSKYRFAKSRWIEGPSYAGFNMYPEYAKQRIVLGWAGQSEAPGYALQVLADELRDTSIWDMVQRSMDHICNTPIAHTGFPVRYEVEARKWHSPDPVSEGQALNSIGLAIRAARKNQRLHINSWENFFRKACDLHATRLLDNSWYPRNTAEAFYIAPMLLAAQLFDDQVYRKAGLKLADYYASRHLDMEEPYWGGTLDANCEDKEGAWGALQGFMAAYEDTGEEKYLQYAKHAGDVVLSYMVVWDIPLPAGRLADHNFKTRGWTGVSPQNQHLDVYGVVMTPTIYKLGKYTHNESLQRMALVMYRSCGQMIDPYGSQGEQIQQTNFAQYGDMSNVFKLRGGYSERWTVFWITAHFLHAAAQFKEMDVRF